MTMKAISFCNQKGGTGKTTTTAALAGGLRERGRFVALIDLDPQGCLSLLSSGVDQIRPPDLPGVLRGLAGMDYVLIDTPPSLGEATRASLEAADGVIIPTLPEFLALRGLGSLLGLIEPGKLIGILVLGFRKRTKHHRRVLEKIEGLGHPVLAIVPFSISASDAGLIGKDLVAYSPAKSRGIVTAYRQLAEEVERWAEKIG